MRKSRFTDEQIIRILNEHEAGRKADEICREHSISEATGRRDLALIPVEGQVWRDDPE